MCGIAGIFNINGTTVSSKVVENMTNMIVHRGPDGWDTALNQQVGLGHRRLAIIDLEGGKQPLSNEDGQIWITFNGEIYNYRELRDALETKGHRFRTRSDTETIVHAYEEWGERCVERFRGMFAFAIVDYRTSRVFLARDQLGIKPLYYFHNNSYFAFASELQAFRCLPDIQLEIDIEAIDQYLWLKYIPAPKTIYQQVHKLLPAHRLTITFDGQTNGPEEYWQFTFRPNRHRSENEWLEALDHILRESVKAHLVADVPFGAFLSGGIDSSAVVAYMAQILDDPVRTFSIGFEEQEYDELIYAKQAAKRWNTEHHVEIVRPDALEILPKLVQHYGEPFGDSSAIPTFYVSQMARRKVPMILSGDGGDELFAGYKSYQSWMRWLGYDGVTSPAWRQMLRPIAERLHPGRQPRRPQLDKWLQYVATIPFDERHNLWRPEYQQIVQCKIDSFEEEFARTQRFSNCNVAQYMDIKSYLPCDILTKVDIASMMHGLEVRTPFVDIRVLEFAATIPESLNIDKNTSGHWEGKLLLKKLMSRYYPATFLNRPKMGFSLPVEQWLAPNSIRYMEIREHLLRLDSPLNIYFAPATLRQLLEYGQARQIWLILFLDEWLKQHLHVRQSVGLSEVV